jgi:hypothetical protein
MAVMVEGSATEIKSEHREKAPPAIFVSPSEKTMVFKPVHCANASDGIVVTLFGMVISVRAAHPQNIFSPSAEHPLGDNNGFQNAIAVKSAPSHRG